MALKKPCSPATNLCQLPDGAPCSTKISLELIILFFHLFYVLLKKSLKYFFKNDANEKKKWMSEVLFQKLHLSKKRGLITSKTETNCQRFETVSWGLAINEWRPKRRRLNKILWMIWFDEKMCIMKAIPKYCLSKKTQELHTWFFQA